MHSLSELKELFVKNEIQIKEFGGWYLKVGKDTWTMTDGKVYKNNQPQSIKDKSIFLATQARDDAPHYEHSKIGYNYRMSNILAGIGRGQMEVLDDRVVARRSNFNYYKN